MYDRSDPRSALASAKPAAPMPGSFAPPQYGRFYDSVADETSSAGKSWYIRGKNFVLCYSEATKNAVFARDAQGEGAVQTKVLPVVTGNDLHNRRLSFIGLLLPGLLFATRQTLKCACVRPEWEVFSCWISLIIRDKVVLWWV